jgi:hypothetical protein
VMSFDPMANGKHRSRGPLNYEEWQSTRNGRPHTAAGSIATREWVASSIFQRL